MLGQEGTSELIQPNALIVQKTAQRGKRPMAPGVASATSPGAHTAREAQPVQVTRKNDVGCHRLKLFVQGSL